MAIHNIIHNDLIEISRDCLQFPNSIQTQGVLLVLQEPELTIIQVSNNTEQFFGLSAKSLINQNIAQLFRQSELDIIRDRLHRDNLEWYNPIMEELIKDECEVALVLSDYIMPDIKGDEVLKRIHEMSPNTLKIMLTGHANLEAVGNAIKNARLYRYVSKPWQSEDLKLTIVEALHTYLQEQKLVEQRIQIEELNQELENLILRTSGLRTTESFNFLNFRKNNTKPFVKTFFRLIIFNNSVNKI
jgi:response regulator RpfG family c-di-GMP phosphodiesterase